MCGIAVIAGPLARSPDRERALGRMLDAQRRRGPDDRGALFEDGIALGHVRLSIIDLSAAGHQPMATSDERYVIVFNGEVYNFIELRAELGGDFATKTDTEVILAAYARWGERCLDKLRGMFAFAIWDRRERTLFCARDRFGVKPLFFARRDDGSLVVASEIKALHAMGIEPVPDEAVWATYLRDGVYDHAVPTFWRGIDRLLPGHAALWRASDGALRTWRWYDLVEKIGARDGRDDAAVAEELLATMIDSVRLRLRSDVPVGITLSGGLDSSLLLALVRRVLGPGCNLHTFTYETGDDRYDETPWVKQMLRGTEHPHHACRLTADDVPALAPAIDDVEDEPCGGLPVLALSRVFARARENGVIVLLEGQGLDEQWAGYDYYPTSSTSSTTPALLGRETSRGRVQGTRAAAGAPEVLTPDLALRAVPIERRSPTGDALDDMQLEDITQTKLPRALRFNDRISMMHSSELREPFLDERLFELALRQPLERRVRGGVRKWLVRQVGEHLLPRDVVFAPKRPVQTPQREWLRGPLSPWARARLERAIEAFPGWLAPDAARAALDRYVVDGGDNSFHIWQWACLGLFADTLAQRRSAWLSSSSASAEAKR